MSTVRRIAPAVLLFFLSPLVAEYLLGDLTISQINALFALAPLYGGGAILIRETIRRTGRSWPSFILLALAYAFLEEAILTQSLFNPNYLHLRLLDYGFVPMLGTALPWSFFVLGIHVVWSMAVPIGLVEAAFPERRTEPWLRAPGLMVVTLFLAAGASLVYNFSIGQTNFRASPLQLSLSGLLAAVSIAVAFFVFPRAAFPERPKPNPPARWWLVGAGALVGGSAFLLANSLGKAHLPPSATTLIQILVAVALVGFFRWANAGRPWTAVQTWAAAVGGMLCYVWLGYTVDRGLHGPGHALEHSLFVVIAVAIALWAGLRVRRALSEQMHRL